MGSLKVRNLLSKKLKRSETRVLIIDDNQIRYNNILTIFQNQNHLVHAFLLDDLKTFEKQLNLSWDLVIFGQAYDLKVEQSITLIQATSKADIPVLLLKPENYSNDQYQSYIHKGIYDVLNLDSADRFYISLVRALSYSRLVQSQQNLLNDLENAQQLKQVLVEEQRKATATIQEGIHSQANPEYLSLFGLKSVDDLVGLPLLDIIQPKRVSDFKSRFKKVTQGQFEFGRFEIDTLNDAAKSQSPLKIEFLPSSEEDAVQITIETMSLAETATGNLDHLNNSNTPVAPKIAKESVLHSIQRFLKNQPAKENALILFSLACCPDSVLNTDWSTFVGYFVKLSEFIKAQTNGTVFKVDTGLYITIIQAESKDILSSRLTGLTTLEKPQLVQIGEQTFHQTVRIGYHIFDSNVLDQPDFNQSHFDLWIAQAYNTRLPKSSTDADFDLSVSVVESARLKTLPSTLSLEAKTVNTPEPSFIIEPASLIIPQLIERIQQALNDSEIQLKYQQLYDKQDISLNTYEVCSGFIHDNQWYNISDLIELDQEPELSIKVDRWILVEACKQLHNFITQYPEAKLVVNLNRHILLRDKQLPELLSKLITIVGSDSSHPLILQFNEEDVAKSLIEANKAIKMLRDHGAEISIRNFGNSISSDTILKQTDIAYFTLDEKLSRMLNSDKELQKLQQQIEAFNTIKPIEMILKGLNDMSAFANAWNVDARFLQGDYFQKKLDYLTDVQDQ